MSVNKVGRPSKARQRREEILLAMGSVVARDGLAATTIAQVAEEAGLQRTLVLHYFRDRDALMSAFISEAVGLYGEQMLFTSSTGSLADEVDRLFEPGAYRKESDLVIWTELVALAARDEDVRGRLHDLWTRLWLPQAERRLRAEHPSAAPELIAETAYSIACLFEAHWAFHLQGLTDDVRRRQLQNAARALLARLGQGGQ